jgi:hypothetical protein
VLAPFHVTPIVNVLVISREERSYRGYLLLTQHITGLAQKLTELDVTDFSMYVREVRHDSFGLWTFLDCCYMKLRKGAAGARGDDAANLKPAIVSWLIDLYPDEKPAPLSPSNKTERGFEHDVTGRLLCPVDYDWQDQR